MSTTSCSSNYWLNMDICGLICGLISDVIILYGMAVFSSIVIVPWYGYSIVGVIHLILFNSIGLLAMISHFRAMTTDPGSVPRDALPLLNDEEELDYEILGKNIALSPVASHGPIDIQGKRQQMQQVTPYKKFCRRCRGFKPARAHHCSICNRCIVKVSIFCMMMMLNDNIDHHLFVDVNRWIITVSHSIYGSIPSYIHF